MLAGEPGTGLERGGTVTIRKKEVGSQSDITVIS